MVHMLNKLEDKTMETFNVTKVSAPVFTLFYPI